MFDSVNPNPTSGRKKMDFTDKHRPGCLCRPCKAKRGELRKTKQSNISFKAEVLESLRSYCDQEGRTQADVVNSAVAEYIKRNNKKK